MAGERPENRMTEGSVAGKITRFAIPLFLGNLFQQLYNTADTLIVGKLLGDTALAAVSSSGSLVFLLVGFFGGLAMGAGVVISQLFGAKETAAMRRAIHTNLVMALVVGLFLTAFGVFLSPQILRWMDTPEGVFGQSVTYVRIYFGGILTMVLYNACTGIMQAVGDSKHPLYYLIVSSCTNVVLDIVFIRFFHMGVGGAAFATVLSQLISVVLCFIRLFRIPSDCRITMREMRSDAPLLKQIIRFGIPSALQNCVIALANVVVQSNINYFGEAAMAGCGAYSKIEGFSFLPVTCFTAAITTFVGQNLGAQCYDRVKKGARFGVLTSIALAVGIGILIYGTAPYLVGTFATGKEAIAFGIEKARTCALFFFLCAATHCLSAVLRGAGHAAVPMVIVLICWCVIRVSILKIVVPITQSIAIVNWVYPITWALSALTLLGYFLCVDWMHPKEKRG